MGERLGILGGTFDPVHCGHLLLARHVLEALHLDRVLFVPAAEPPHKTEVLTASEHRWRMVCAALEGHQGLEASDLELRRPGVSYTVDTLRRLRGERPRDELFLIIGADNVPELDGWHDPEGILELAAVVAGSRVEAGDLPGGAFVDRVERVETPIFDISSTEIRRRVRAGLPVRCLVPEAVEGYIADHGLYGTP